jgi:predicted hydrolase (HD superfamily)
LLHDIDYEETKNDPDRHSIIGAEILEKLGLDKDIVEAVKTHNEAHGIAPETRMAKAIFCVDPLTGLIVASTLVLPASPAGGPSKKIVDLTSENVLNRFKEKGFAKGANREIISKCEELLGLKLEQFIEICLKAMQGISENLGL